MLKPHELEERRLLQIVSDVVDVLYFDHDTGKYDRDKEWDAGDAIQEVADIITFYNLTPDWGHDDNNNPRSDQDILKYRELAKANRCGVDGNMEHSACSQNYIDTGDASCILPNCERCERLPAILQPCAVCRDLPLMTERGGKGDQ